MVTLAATTLALRLGSWSNAHAKELTGAFVVFLIAAIACGLFYGLTQEKPTRDPWEHLVRDSSGKVIIGTTETVSGNVVGRDSSGHQKHNAPGGTVIVGDGGRVASPQFEYVGLNLPPSPLGESLPRLLIRSPQKRRLLEEDQVFRIDNSGLPGMVVWVENPEAEVGQRGVKATGVAAVIRFMGDGEHLGVSERSFWVDYMENQIDLAPGESRAIVVGLYEPGLWRLFTNARKRHITPGRGIEGMRAYYRAVSPLLQPTAVFFNPFIEAQISVLSDQTNVTLARKGFRLSTFRTTMGDVDFKFEELQ